MLLLLGYYKFKNYARGFTGDLLPLLHKPLCFCGFLPNFHCNCEIMSKTHCVVCSEWKSMGSQGRRWKYIQNMLIRLFF